MLHNGPTRANHLHRTTTTRERGAKLTQYFVESHENSLAFRLLSRLGSAKSVAAITAICTAASILLTVGAGYFFNYTQSEMIEAIAIASVVSAIISSTASFWVVRLASDLIAARKTLLRLANRDDLTQLYNRRYFAQQLERALESRPTCGQSLGILLLDVDRLKQINDALGHHAGDQVLISVADAARSAVRRDDLVARYAGDEFAVLLSPADENNALEVSARIRLLLASSVDNARRYSLEAPPTISIGVAIHIDAEPSSSLLRRADAALYEAKKSGRDTVAVAPVATKSTGTTPAPT